MNKTQLIDFVAESTKLDRTQARDAIDAFLKGITQALKSDDHATLIGFGSFRITKRAARNGYNPRVGEKMRVRSTKVVKFTASAKLKDLAKTAKASKKTKEIKE